VHKSPFRNHIGNREDPEDEVALSSGKVNFGNTVVWEYEENFSKPGKPGEPKNYENQGTTRTKGPGEPQEA